MGLSKTLLYFALVLELVLSRAGASAWAQGTPDELSFCERSALIFDDSALFNIDKWPADKQRVFSPREVALPPSLRGDQLTFNAAVPVAVATGNVWFHYDGNSLTADELSLDRPGGVIRAHGNVRITDAYGKVTYADMMELTSDLSDVFERLVSCPSPSFKRVRGTLPDMRRR